MSYQIFHNPRCSKSRQTLGLLEENGIKADVVEYLKDTPDEQSLKTVIKLLGISPRELLRKGEEEYKIAGLDDQNKSDEDIIKAMVRFPKLIERPIVIKDNKKAIIGRPPERVLDLIK